MPAARAQQVVADGVPVTASGTIDTGTITAAPGFGLSALNGGSILTNSPIIVITGGQDALGASANSGGSISLFDGSTVSTSGAGAVGALANGTGSRLTATGLTLETTGEPSTAAGLKPAHGVVAANGGEIALAGGTVTTRGGGAFGLYSSADLGSPATLLTATDTVVRTFGDTANGADVIGGQMILNNVAVETSGAQAIGVRADRAGTITMSGGSINTTGAGGTGVLGATDTRISLTDVDISLGGADARGIGAQQGAQITVSGGSVLTTGDRSYGISSAAVSPDTNARSLLDVTGTTITTGGTNAHGLRVLGGGDAILSGSTLTTAGTGASAIFAAASGSNGATAAITDSTLASSQAFGVRTEGVALDLILTGAALSGGAGLLSTGSGGVLNLTADASTLIGGAFTDAASTSNLTLQNGTLWTVTGAASSLTSLSLDNSTVRYGNDSTLSASNDISILAGGGTFDTNGFTGTVSSSVSGTGGLEKTGAGTLVLAAANTYSGGTTITAGTLQLGNGGTSGSITGDVLNNGALAFNRSDAVVFGGKVTGAGQLQQAGSGTTILTAANTYSGGTVISQGTLQLGNGGTSGSITGDVLNNGVLAFDRGDAALFSGDITGTGQLRQIGSGTTVLAGASSYSGGTVISQGTLQLGIGGTTGSIQGDVANNGSLVFNRSNELQLDGAISGTGSVTQAGVGVTILTGSNSYGASTTVSAGTLAAGAANTFSSGSAHSVQAGGTLDLRGFNQTVASLNNGGMVRLGGLPGTTLSVSDAYVSQGGFLGFNSVLDDDASATDQLVAGRVERGSDATGVIVNKVGGTGALTSGNGIKLVHVNDATASAAGAFKLAGRVTSGVYEYTLYQGGINGAAGDGNWYLRSTLDCSAAENASACDGHLPEKPIEPPVEPPVEPPIEPPVTPPTGPQIPDYRAETSLYTALPSMALLYGRNLMDSRVERIGDESTGRTASGSQGWGRIIGLKGSRDGSSGGIYTGGPAYDYDIFALQTGVDLYRADRPDGSGDRAGVYGAVGQISADVTHFNGRDAGKNKIDAYSLGAYWTRLGASGWYLDGVGQLTWNDAKSTPNGMSGLDTDGLSLAASIEGGQRFQFDGGFSVEPQAQLVYQTAHLSGASDAAASVRFSDIDSLAARVGVRFAQAWPLDGQAGAPRQIKAWLRPSVWHEFLGEPKTEFSSASGSVPFKDKLDGSWAEIAAGLDADVSKNTSIYGNLGYQVGFDGKSDAYTAKVGLRITW